MQRSNHQIIKSPYFVTCLVLYSGGLDSILACKILQEQGIRVIAVHFITPFFGHKLKGQGKSPKKEALARHNIEFKEIDISEPYLEILKNPEHGYGKCINPCIDCKILMIRETAKRLNEFNASFIATGEILGQRPMSQRRDALRIIEKESGVDGRLLRPLSALRLQPTEIENKGMVDRSKLLGLAGRGRKNQIALAQKYGIKEYSSSAGGCLLVDPIIAQRLKCILDFYPQLNINDCLLSQLGRHFILHDKSWLVIGREEKENAKILSLMEKDDIKLQLSQGPGPIGLWRKSNYLSDLDSPASILCRYAKVKKYSESVTFLELATKRTKVIMASPAPDDIINKYRI